MSVLVTGGAGYIGAHVVRLLQERGEQPIVIDNLSTSAASRIGDVPLFTFDLSDPDATERLTSIIEDHDVTALIHFAAKKQVGESVAEPVAYYRSNIGGLVNVLQAMQDTGVRRIVFSSSAAVYGAPTVPVVTEDYDCHPINPYGQTKFAGEWLIDATAKAQGIAAAKLRYFNVAGSGWDDLGDPAILNLVPMVFNRLEQGKAPLIFGDDYPTDDGTCVRDYIHVYDLADAHIRALDYLDRPERAESTFNIGTGHGYSVRQVIDEILRVTDAGIEPDVSERRPGDPPLLVADASRVQREFEWKPQFGLTDIVESAWSAWRHDHDGGER